MTAARTRPGGHLYAVASGIPLRVWPGQRERAWQHDVLHGCNALSCDVCSRQYQPTNGVIAMGHRAMVQTLRQDKSHISHSLHTLAARGLIVIGRTPGGKADSLDLTAEGRKVASEIAYSCA